MRRRKPNHQRWYAEWNLSWNMYTLHTRFPHVRHRFCMLSRCLLTKISASELSRRFIKNVLLVGKERERETPQLIVQKLFEHLGWRRTNWIWSDVGG